MKRDLMRQAEEASAGRDLSSYPLRLYAHHMAEIYGFSLKQFYRYENAGDFVFAQIRPTIGRKTWDRERVAVHFAGRLRGVTAAREMPVAS